MGNLLTIPTAEPFFFPGNETGCLLIHGYTGAPKEMRWFGEYLHKKGYTVLGIRLFAHATQPDDMLRARWRDWLACVEDGINILKGCSKRIYVMGLSMGAILSLIAASRYPVAGAVSISAPYSMPADPRIKFIKWLRYFHPRESKGESDFHNKDAESDHVDYPYFPTRSVIELIELIKVMQESLAKISIPVMLVQSHGDNGIPADSLDQIFNHLGSRIKEKLWVEDSGHVVVREPERFRVFDAVDAFIKNTSP